MDENKKVTYKHLQPGQEIKGYSLDGRSCLYTAIVKSINPSFVTVLAWGKLEEKIDSRGLFYIKMSEQEIKDKYRDKAKEVLNCLKNKLSRNEIGYHEMWNTWLSYTPYEIAQNCAEYKIKVLGYCSDITPKTAMFSGDTLDVGVCAEYEDGERFWCHFQYKNIEKMLKKYKDLLD
jgi:hypothetical protein